MSRVLLLLFPALLVWHLASAQYGVGRQELMGNKRSDVYMRCPRFYAGLTTGVNSPVGFLGAQIDMPVTQQVSVCPGFGFGTWGWKGSIEGRYYFSRCNRGFALGLGGSYAAGGTLLVIERNNSSGGSETFRFFQRPAFNLLMSASYFVSLGRQGHRAFFQAGYSLPLNGDRLEQLDGSQGVIPRERWLELQAPAGPMVAGGVSFGIGQFRE